MAAGETALPVVVAGFLGSGKTTLIVRDLDPRQIEPSLVAFQEAVASS